MQNVPQWLLWAGLSAVFAALTALFAKVGVKGVDPDLAMAIRTLVVAAVIFGERPDAATLAGAALIALAGGYAMWREAGLRRRRPVDSLVRPGPG